MQITLLFYLDVPIQGPPLHRSMKGETSKEPSLQLQVYANDNIRERRTRENGKKKKKNKNEGKEGR